MKKPTFEYQKPKVNNGAMRTPIEFLAISQNQSRCLVKKKNKLFLTALLKYIIRR